MDENLLKTNQQVVHLNKNIQVSDLKTAHARGVPQISFARRSNQRTSQAQTRNA